MVNPRFLLISLGNQQPYYETLHSAGHHALNALQALLGGGQPRFGSERLGGKSCLSSIGPNYIMAQSPTMMNICGPWVAKTWKDVLSRNDLSPAELSLVLVHDDLEEDLGFVKIRKWERSHRGHNGVRSVNDSLKKGNYPGARWSRISIGIGRPQGRDKAGVSDYVLRRITNHEKTTIKEKAAPRLAGCLRELQEAWEKEAQTDAEARQAKA